MTSSMYIGLTGFARTGKDTIAEYLKTKGFKQLAFATAVRETALVVNAYIPEVGKRYRDILDEMGYEQAKSIPQVREYLISIGHGCRQSIKDSVWVDKVKDQLDEGKYVISDVRYENEAKMIRDKGGIIVKVLRPGYEGVHQTEIDSIAQVRCNITINNDSTFEYLYAQVDSILEEYM